jgi:hypothetical protein
MKTWNKIKLDLWYSSTRYQDEDDIFKIEIVSD